MALHIIIPTYNRFNSVRNLIVSLKSQSYDNFQIVLVDDGADGTSRDFVTSQFPGRTHVILGNGNLWWAESLQKAYEHLYKKAEPSDAVLILNDDVELPEEFLSTGMGLLSQFPDSFIQAVGRGKQQDTVQSGVHIDWRTFSFSQTFVQDQINCLSTRGLITSWNTMLRVGSFYPSLLRHYTSDYEYTIRAYRKGVRLIVDKDFYLYYDEQTTGVKSIDYSLKFFNFFRNLFSRRSVNNPLTLLVFVLLASPWKHKLRNAIRMIFRAVHIFFLYFKYRIPQRS